MIILDVEYLGQCGFLYMLPSLFLGIDNILTSLHGILRDFL